MLKWKDYKLNGVILTILLNTKRHIWEIHTGTPGEKPALTFAKGKGDAVIKFIEFIQEREE